MRALGEGGGVDHNTDQARLPLAGLKVISMAEQYPGPFCTLMLSDFGADVIQVERPGTGDPSRFLAPFYESLNRGKRSLALDARKPEDHARLLALLDTADVFLEGFRPGKLAKLGLDWETLSERNPRLIYCSISGFGQTGPYRDRPAHDITYQGVGGALDERLSGDVTGLPPGFLLGDTMSALYAAIGVLTALQGRERTGKGTYLDVSMSDTVTAAFTAFAAMAGQDGPAPPQAEPAYDMFECADATWLTLSIAHEDAYWARLCGTLGLEDVADLKRPERVARRAEFKARIADVIKTKPRDHWAEVLDASDQMWGPVNALGDLATDPHILARGLMQRLMRADGAEQWIVRQPIRFSAYDNAPLSRAPGVGEHADATFDGVHGTDTKSGEES
ncbi:MAG: CaiB/BaiF CoA-transferase family protein [Pseudomonadota bacterium]